MTPSTPSPETPEAPTYQPGCGCARCDAAKAASTPGYVLWIRDRMYLCPTCGNKRCPRATAHWLVCTSSNEPGQPGSDYGDSPASIVIAPEAPSETVSVGSGEQAYTIKPLEWKQESDDGRFWTASTVVGFYTANPTCWTGLGHYHGRTKSLAESKAGAEADYRQRLAAALSPSSSPPAAAGEGDVLERAAKLAGIPEPLTESLLHLAMMVDQFGPCFFGRRDIDAVRLLAARVVELTAENEKLKEMPLKYYPPASTSPADQNQKAE